MSLLLVLLSPGLLLLDSTSVFGWSPSFHSKELGFLTTRVSVTHPVLALVLGILLLVL